MPEIVDVLDVIASAYESQERRMESQLRYSLGMLEIESEKAWRQESASRENFVFAMGKAEERLGEEELVLADEWIGRLELIAQRGLPDNLSYKDWVVAASADANDEILISDYYDELEDQLGSEEGLEVYQLIQDYYSEDQNVKKIASKQALRHAQMFSAELNLHQAEKALIRERNVARLEGETMWQGQPLTPEAEDEDPAIGGRYRMFSQAGAFGERTTDRDGNVFWDAGRNEKMQRTLELIEQSFELRENIDREYLEMSQSSDYKIDTPVYLPTSAYQLPATGEPILQFADQIEEEDDRATSIANRGMGGQFSELTDFSTNLGRDDQMYDTFD